LLGSILLTWIGAIWIIERWIVNPEWMESEQLAPDIVAGIALPLGLIAGVLVFGFVSLRFERQADAFAVKHMAGDISLGGEGILISEDAAGAMSESLRQVARYNHISLDRFTWRHGSIAQRIAAIHGLTGRSTRKLPIDRQIRIIKIVSLLAIVGLIVLAVRDHSILE